MASAPRLKIAYLCETHPSETWAHSGGNTRIYQALQTHVGDVSVIDDRWGKLEFVRQLIHRLPDGIRLRLRFRVHLLLSPFISRHLARQLAKERYDLLFCAYSFFCLANLRLPYPMPKVFTSDATFTIYKKSPVGKAFRSHFALSRLFDSLILRAERRVYRGCDLLLWPSAWIKSEADKLYELDSQNSVLVPWGANIPPPQRETLCLDNPITGQVKLLLVGRDWFPKGGPMVFEVLKALLERGIDAHLTVVGCVPPDFHRHEKMTVHAQLDKNDPEQLATFTGLYRDSHFFVMPSYEAYGFAFCEAAAYGLPALCLKVGGVPVKEGMTGHALPEGSSAADFADKIAAYTNKADEYRKLRQSTRDYYETHLHWDAWGQQVADLVRGKLDGSA